MKRIHLAAGLALALAAPAFAQSVPETAPPADQSSSTEPAATTTTTTTASDESVNATAESSMSSELPTNAEKLAQYRRPALAYTGPHSYPTFTRSGSRAGEPKIVDHRMDSAIVEPPRTTVNVATAPAAVEQRY